MTILKGWRTVIFNTVALLVLVLNHASEVPWIPPDVVNIGLVLGNLVLRYVTTGPIGTVK